MNLSYYSKPRRTKRQIIYLFALILVLATAFSGYQAHAATISMQLAAVSGQGYNPTTAVLSRNTTFEPIVQGATSTSVTWSLQGAGTLTSAGVYTAPDVMPSNPSVTVTAVLAASPSITASYTVTLINPAPTMSAIYPTSATPGTTTTLSVGGAYFTTQSQVMVNGTAMPTTFVSANKLTAAVSIKSGTTGSVAVTVSTPTPGGGASTAATLSMSNPTVAVNATSGQGYNPTTAVLGRNTSFAAVVQNSASPAVTWSLSGPGTLTSAGVYTAPATMPSSGTIVVKATLASNTSVSSSYTMSLVSPAPTVSAISPTSATAGTTTTLYVAGTSFIQGSTILVNGVPMATTFLSANKMSAQVPISASATGALPITVVTPAPGGGASNALSLTLSGASLKLNAVSGQGYNPTTALLNRNTTIQPYVTGSTSTAVTYSLNGPGTLTSAGVYTAPMEMPSTQTVTITAALQSQPSVTATYQMTLQNPLATVTAVLPTVISSGANVIKVAGSGFNSSSVVLVNGAAVPTTLINQYGLTAQVQGVPGETQSLSISVQNPTPGGGVSNALSISAAVPGMTGATPATLPTGTPTVTITGNNFSTSTVAFLDGQPVATSFVSPTKITAVAHVAPWRTDSVTVGISTTTTSAPATTISLPITNQTAVTYDQAARFSTQVAFGPRPDVVAQIQQLGFAAFTDQQLAQPASTYPVPYDDMAPEAQFTLNALQGTNLLRQRVAFALQEFITTSVLDGQVTKSGLPWQLLMEKDAFGNFRDLMTDITLSPVMGEWLNLGDNWATTNPNVHPNQNYARELLQLFTIGSVQLNMDGSTALDGSGNPISTIDTNTVLDLTRALTGWAFPPTDGSEFSGYDTDYGVPMIATDSRHDHGEKTLFGTTTLPAGQNISQDLKSALDAIFNHPNVPPFISKILIQHLVKSNPSPAYIERIANVFANDGTGVRGNLKAVVRAILLDPEARAGDNGTVAAGDGHLQEPIIYFLNVMSGLQMAPTGQNFVVAEQGLGQHLWFPDTVFSYYSPSFNIPGTTINAPEFQIFDGNYQIQRSQVLYNVLNGTQYDFSLGYRNTDWFFSYFSTIPSIVDAVNHMYFHGTMPASAQSAIISYAESLSTLSQQQTAALYLALNSDSFQISY